MQLIVNISCNMIFRKLKSPAPHNPLRNQSAFFLIIIKPNILQKSTMIIAKYRERNSHYARDIDAECAKLIL